MLDVSLVGSFAEWFAKWLAELLALWLAGVRMLTTRTGDGQRLISNLMTIGHGSLRLAKPQYRTLEEPAEE